MENMKNNIDKNMRYKLTVRLRTLAVVVVTAALTSSLAMATCYKSGGSSAAYSRTSSTPCDNNTCSGSVADVFVEVSRPCAVPASGEGSVSKTDHTASQHTFNRIYQCIKRGNFCVRDNPSDGPTGTTGADITWCEATGAGCTCSIK